MTYYLVFRFTAACATSPCLKGGGPGAVSGLSWLLEMSEIAGSNPTLAFKFQEWNISSRSLNIVGSLCEREVACSTSELARARICPVSEGHFHLIILRRFFWPSSAYMFTKVAQNLISDRHCPVSNKIILLYQLRCKVVGLRQRSFLTNHSLTLKTPKYYCILLTMGTKEVLLIWIYH